MENATIKAINRFKNSFLLAALKEHEKVCSQHERNSKFTRIYVCLIYCIFSFVIDLDFCIAFYSTNPVIRNFFIAISIACMIFLFLFGYTAISLTKSVNASYKLLNSMIVKKQHFNLHQKMQIINLLKRLGQTHVAV